MKKICLILICMVISAFSLSSCGNSDNEAQSVANVVSTVTISCAGDCTLASDESFSDNTFGCLRCRDSGVPAPRSGDRRGRRSRAVRNPCRRAS